MYEEKILTKLYEGISQRLRSCNDSRIFYTQSVISLTSYNGLDALGIKENNMSSNNKNNKNINNDNNNSNVINSNNNINNNNNIDDNDNRRNNKIDNEINYYETNNELDVRTNETNNDIFSARNSDENHGSSTIDSVHVMSSYNGTDRDEDKSDRFKSILGPSSSSSSSTSSSSKNGSNNSTSTNNAIKTAPHKFVRTDPSLVKINAFYKPSQTPFLLERDNENCTSNISGNKDNTYNNKKNDSININNEKNENEENEENEGNYCGICLPDILLSEQNKDKNKNKIKNKNKNKNGNSYRYSIGTLDVDSNQIKEMKSDTDRNMNSNTDDNDHNKYGNNGDDNENESDNESDNEDDNDFKTRKIMTESIDCTCCGNNNNRYKKIGGVFPSLQINEDELIRKNDKNNNYKNSNIDNISNNYNNTKNNEFRRKLVKFDDTKCQYASVKSLITELKNSRHEGLERILRNHTFVGIIDSTYCSVQYGTKLLLLDYNILLYHLFYQFALRKFGEMPRIILGSPVPIREYVLSALYSSESGWKDVEKEVEKEVVEELQSEAVVGLESGLKSDQKLCIQSIEVSNKNKEKENNKKKELFDSRESVADRIVKKLIENSEMLQEYFRIGVNEQGYLCTLPDLLVGYLPEPEGLPMFLVRLVTETNWNDEILCFRSIAKEIGYYYSSLPLYNDINDSNIHSNKTYDNNDDDNNNNDNNNDNEHNSDDNKNKNILNTNDKKKINELISSNKKFEELFTSLLFPAIRLHLIAPKQCASDGNTVVQLAALEQLYKIFERC